MTKCRYLIEGKLYDNDIDLPSIIISLTNKHNLEANIEPTENGFSLEIEADIVTLLDFEPILFKKIASFMEIRLYTKKKPKSEENAAESEENAKKPFKISAQYLRQEKIIAIKGNNGFHLVCNASKTQAVKAFREIINQPDKPLFVMYKNLIKAKQLILISKQEEELLQLQENPIVLTKLRQLHRLEKSRIKHKLTPMINPVNHRIGLSLIHNELYEKLFYQIDFPLVSIDALDKNGVIISDIEKLSQTYGEGVDYILDSDEDISTPKQREVLQTVYGRTQKISPKPLFCKDCEVCLDYEKSNILDFKLKPLKLLEKDEPKYSALALLFTNLPIEQILKLKLPFTKNEIKKLHKKWKESSIKSTSFLTLFDAIATLSGELQQKSFAEQSVMLTEEHYEVCEEDTFDFTIKNAEIEIDIVSTYLKNNKLKHLGSTLVNTISTIIAQIAKNKTDHLHLCGELFNFRDLCELTIEKLENEHIKAILT